MHVPLLSKKTKVVMCKPWPWYLTLWPWILIFFIYFPCTVLNKTSRLMVIPKPGILVIWRTPWILVCLEKSLKTPWITMKVLKKFNILEIHHFAPFQGKAWWICWQFTNCNSEKWSFQFSIELYDIFTINLC